MRDAGKDGSRLTVWSIRSNRSAALSERRFFHGVEEPGVGVGPNQVKVRTSLGAPAAS